MLHLDKSYTNGIILRRARNNKQFKLGMENLDISVYHFGLCCCVMLALPKIVFGSFNRTI